MIGKEISHYRVLEKIGEGGMGLVYKAEDTTLKRTVAMKFLPVDRLSSDEDRARFRIEAQAAASLRHPGICTVFELGEVDGQSFIAMEYLEGRDLAKTLADGPLDIDVAIRYGIQIAQALEEAHSNDVIHRDIKAANIVVTAKQGPVLLDFGLARLADSPRLTVRQNPTGTAAYMSPEQTAGEETDLRTDIWSFGVVLYEMATGRVPFRGEYSAAVAYAVVNEDPEPPSRIRPEVGPDLERVILRALEKDPADRYGSAREIVADLESLRSGGAVIPAKPAKAQVPSVAVLPFANMSADPENEYFSDGITEDITLALSQVDGLRVTARNSAFQFKGAHPSPQDVGKKLGVDHVLAGSVRRSGDRLRITVQLSDASGHSVWSERYDRVLNDVFEIQDEISQAIVDKLRVQLIGQAPKRIVARSTENLDAYNLYLQGRYHLNQRNARSFELAIERFTQAVAEDPDYVLPWAGLAEAHVLVAGAHYGDTEAAEHWDEGRKAARRAVDLDASSADAHVALGLVLFRADWDWYGAEREFLRAIELNDRHVGARHQYAMLCAALGRFDQAVEEVRRAHALDPLSPLINTALTRTLEFAGRYDEALEQALHTLELNPNFGAAHFDLYEAYAGKKMYPEALKAIRRMRELTGNESLETLCASITYKLMGDEEQARREYDRLFQLAESLPVPKFYFALLLAYFGDLDRGFEYLEEAYRNRDPRIVYLNTELSFDIMRKDPRFRAFLERLNFPVNP